MKRVVPILILVLAVCALLPSLASAQTANPAQDAAFLRSLQAPAGAAPGDLTGVPAPTYRACSDCFYTYYNVCVPSCAPGDQVCRQECQETEQICLCNAGCGMQFCR
jgi:hypothetical protein